MKDTLINFETAKLAKEKGFNIECLQAYRVWRENIRKNDKNPLEEIDVEYEPYMGGSSATVCYHYQSKDYTLAPTQSFLQKFLREIHGLYAYIDWLTLDYVIVDYKNKDGEEVYRETRDFEGDEDDINNLLQEALKLIEK